MRYKTIIMGYILVPIDKKQPLAEIAFNGTATGGGTVSGTGASPTVDLTAVTGYGSGGQVAVTKGGDATIATATITVKTAGDGYAIGDVVSFAAITTGAARAISWCWCTSWVHHHSFCILSCHRRFYALWFLLRFH